MTGKAAAASTDCDRPLGTVESVEYDGTVERQSVALVVPCFNEEEVLERLATALVTLQQRLVERYQFEVVLVDDGSTDGTWNGLRELVARHSGFRAVRHDRNRGLAAAMLTGIHASDADIACVLDADCSYDPRQVEDLLARMTPGVDVVTASPYHPLGRVEQVSAWRLSLSKIASRAYRRVFRQKLHTYTSCFRAYRTRLLREIQLQHAGFVGVTELLWQLDALGARIVECPTVLAARQGGQSKMRVVRTAWAHACFWLQAARRPTPR